MFNSLLILKGYNAHMNHFFFISKLDFIDFGRIYELLHKILTNFVNAIIFTCISHQIFLKVYQSFIIAILTVHNHYLDLKLDYNYWEQQFHTPFN